MSGLKPGDTICLRGDTSGAGRVYAVSNIQLTVNGTAAAPITMRPYPGERVILRNNANNPLLRFEAKYWVVEDLALDNGGRSKPAVMFNSGVQHNILRGSEIFNGKHNGIELRAGSSHTLLENNHVHHFAHSDLIDAHCVYFSAGANNNMIRGNTIHDCSGDGLHIIAPAVQNDLSQAANNNQIRNNVFYRGTLPRTENAVDIKAATNLIVFGNRMSGYDQGAAVILQKASRGVVFDSNIIHDSVRGFNLHDELGGWPQDLTVKNNIFYDVDEYAIQIMGVRNGVFVHNTIVDAGRAFNVAGRGLTGGAIRNNLVVNSVSARRASGAAFQNVVVGPNGWFSSATDFSSAGDVMGSGSPGFVDAASRNYRLRPDSVAVNKGVEAGVSVDFEGDARPSNVFPDLGADEYALGLRLQAAPEDQALRLSWTPFDHDELETYDLIYSAASGLASQDTIAITDLLPNTLAHKLTGLTNYQAYQVTVVARDADSVELGMSNTVVAIVTDIFIFLPVVNRP